MANPVNPTAFDPISLLTAESGLSNALYGEVGTGAQAQYAAQGQTTAAQGQATAFGIEAGGATAEAQAYGTAGQIAQQQGQLVGVSAQIQQAMETRKLMGTLGEAAATTSAAGFGASGSALDIARGSLQRGLLSNQIIGTNAQIEAGGYAEQAAASQAEVQAAQTAASAASANQQTAQTQAQIATQQGATLTQLSQAQAAQTSQFINQIPSILQTQQRLQQQYSGPQVTDGNGNPVDPSTGQRITAPTPTAPTTNLGAIPGIQVPSNFNQAVGSLGQIATAASTQAATSYAAAAAGQPVAGNAQFYGGRAITGGGAVI